MEFNIGTFRVWKTLLTVILFSGCIGMAGIIYLLSKILQDPAFIGMVGVVLGTAFGVLYTNLYIRKTRPSI